jgi:hypothetical protein
MRSNYTILKRLSEFINKYYRNEILKGSFLLVLVSLSAFILFVGVDYLFQLNQIGRGILFFSWLAIFLIIFFTKIIVPILKLFKVSNGLTTEQAAQIIGVHFPNINDKLLNAVQLINDANFVDNELLIASINQRNEALSPLPFNSAINFKTTFSVLKWASIPLGIFAFLWFYSPQLIQNGTTRIVNYQEKFTPQAPFSLVADYNNNPFMFDDVAIAIDLSGNMIPSNVYLNYNGVNYLCEQVNGKFLFIIKQVQTNGSFSINANEFSFGPYAFEVVRKPSIQQYNLQINYPTYLKQAPAVFANLTDITVPEGSYLTWRFDLNENDSLFFNSDIKNTTLGNPASIKLRALANFNYQFGAFNKNVFADTSAYFVQILKDKYPIIKVNRWSDSTTIEEVNFTGNILDDYGFTKLLVGLTANGVVKYIDTLTINKQLSQQDFFYSFNVTNYINQQDLKLVFDVWDNDGVNGAKRSRSSQFELEIPSKNDIQEKSNETTESLIKEMKESLKSSDELQKEWKKFSDELKSKQKTDWQDKKKLEQLLKKQEDLQKNLENINNKKQQKDALENLSPSEKNELVQKQEAVNKLFEDLMSDEMKKMMEEIEKLMQDLNKEDLQKQLENFEMNNEQLNKELDRTLEVFKQLELEKMVNQTTEKLEELAKKQEELAKKAEDKNADSEKLAKEQEALNKEFDEVKKDLAELQEKNDALESPESLPETKEQEEAIDSEMQDAQDALNKDKKKQAGQKQQSAADQMKQMAQNLKQSMQSSSQEQMEEDLDALRALLENIIHLSFDQENAMQSLASLDPLDPQYLQINRNQSQYKENSLVIQDSLFALSKRIPQLSNIVNKEISQLTSSMEKAIAAMAESQTNEALTRQQYAMTSLNNLALLLDEALKQLQEQSANEMPGNANCKKPGEGKKPNSAKMESMQKAMAKQLDALKKAMEKGNNPDKNGKGGSQGGLSKDLAKIATEQAAIRKEIQKLSNELENGKDGIGGELKEIAKEMDKLEEEIAKKQISPELIKRQQDIMTRLLKAENAEREREMDNKRESKSAKDLPKGNQSEYLEYKKKKLNELELLRTLPADLKPYYKDKINTYFNYSN